MAEKNQYVLYIFKAGARVHTQVIDSVLVVPRKGEKVSYKDQRIDEPGNGVVESVEHHFDIETNSVSVHLG